MCERSNLLGVMHDLSEWGGGAQQPSSPSPEAAAAAQAESQAEARRGALLKAAEAEAAARGARVALEERRPSPKRSACCANRNWRSWSTCGRRRQDARVAQAAERSRLRPRSHGSR